MTTRFADHLTTGVHASRPAANAVPAGSLYSCTTHNLVYQSDGVSTWTTWASLVGSVATDPIIDAKGDLIVGTAADAASRLAVGSNNQVLVADSAQTTGVKWAAVPGGGYVAVDTLWDAKGDLAVGSGADAAGRLAVGTNNQVLTADSAQTLGVKWASAAAGSVAADTIWDTKGDLAVATGADAASKLAVGSNGQVLTADSTQTTGIKWAAAGGGGAMTLLSTTTIAGSAATFDVSSISGSYNDLMLVMIARGDSSTSVVNVQLAFNGDTGTHYGSQSVVGSGATASAAANASRTNCFLGGAPAGTATANAYGVYRVVISGYASTSWMKHVMSDGSYFYDISTTGESRRSFHTWNQTSAITRVVIDNSGAGGGLWAIGSVLRIYGVL